MFVGGGCGVYEGTVVRERAVLAAGVILTRGSRVYDLVRETVHAAIAEGPLEIPAGAVVVVGAGPSGGGSGSGGSVTAGRPGRYSPGTVVGTAGTGATVTGGAGAGERVLPPASATGPLSWYRALRLPGGLRTGRTAVPTLYVWSDRDTALGRRAAEGTAAHVDGPYRFVVLPGVSHWVPEERPAELAALVLGHLAAHPLDR